MSNKYMNSFLKEEDGIETIEFVGMIAVAAVLIAALIGIGGKLTEKASQAGTAIGGVMDRAIGEMNNSK